MVVDATRHKKIAHERDFLVGKVDRIDDGVENHASDALETGCMSQFMKTARCKLRLGHTSGNTGNLFIRQRRSEQSETHC